MQFALDPSTTLHSAQDDTLKLNYLLTNDS